VNRPQIEPRPSALLPFLVGLAPFAYLVWRFRFLTDDCYISFRYARNLAAGHGLTFNIADAAAPVEGYSNFLWVLVMAGFERLGVPAPSVVHWITIASGVLLLAWVSAFLVRRVCATRSGAVAGALFFGTFPPLALWSTGGLATMPLALAVFGAFHALLADPERPRGLRAGVWAGAAALLRADGAFWVGLVLLAAAVRWLLLRRPGLLRAILTCAGVLALVLAAHLAFRQLTYGEWLPNTARAKVSVSELSPELVEDFYRRGTNYVVSFFLTFTSGLLALLLALRLLARPAGGAALSSAIVLLGTLWYARHVGGDFMTMGRFLVPALVFLAVLFAAAVDRFAAASRRGRALAAGLIAAACVLSLLPAFDRHPVPYELRYRFHFRWNKTDGMLSERGKWAEMKANAERWVVLGKALQGHTRPGESLAYGAIGAVGYYSDVYLYDTYGLTNRDVLEAPLRIKRLKSPGHDRTVDVSFFANRDLTYAGASTTPADDPWSVLPPRFPRPPEEHPVFVYELLPLDEAEGFPPNLALLLLRPRR